MSTETPTPQHISLRFKKHKITVLLFVSPHDTFTTVKSNLLDAIISTGVPHINGDSLPANPEDVILGVLIDNNDPSQGWVDLEIPGPEDDGGKKTKKANVLNATPSGAGLKDGMVLAFKFRPKDAVDSTDVDNNEWDVVMPAYDDEDNQVRGGGEEGEEEDDEVPASRFLKG
ncbi:MAG: hypothetical protein LQ346_000141 [Caloplaca aetnensis]|nr:MAG: hypothetical protein LQ346_000141 [Caloplaca aetnensis]